MKEFINDYFHRYNAGILKHAAQSWVDLDRRNGKMFLTMAGAMSTGRMGKIVAELIHAGKISALSVTAANLEESVFDLFGRDKYIDAFDYRHFSKEEEEKIRDRNQVRVTDVLMPYEVFFDIFNRIRPILLDAEKKGERLYPPEIFYRLFAQKGIEKNFVVNAEECWLYAAWQMKIPVFAPCFADSTMGNMIVAENLLTKKMNLSLIKNDFEQMVELVHWYKKQIKPTGFFQIGGGVAGDYPICVVPLIINDLKEDVPYWDYFCQISDSTTSFGGYSGANPAEKITWTKLSKEAPMFMIESDATIAFPLIARYVLDS